MGSCISEKLTAATMGMAKATPHAGAFSTSINPPTIVILPANPSAILIPGSLLRTRVIYFTAISKGFFLRNTTIERSFTSKHLLFIFCCL